MAYIGSLVHKAIRSAGHAPSGPFTAILEGDSAAASVTHTVVVPVEGAPTTIPLDEGDDLIVPGDALRLRTFSGVLAGLTTFEGSQGEIPQQLERLHGWTVQQGYRPEPRHRLVILRGPMHRMPNGRRVYPNEMIWELQQELSTP
jgi:hypothetical protein